MTLQDHASGGQGGDAPMAEHTATDSQLDDASEPDGGAASATRLANMLRGQKFTAEMVGERRVRATAGPGSRGVEIECRRRASDGGRWWFAWGGTVWICEADNPTDAMVQVKASLRSVGAAR